MRKSDIRNQKGQGLIEYLIIVALVAVAAISILQIVGQNVTAQFAKVAYAIQGKSSSSVKADEVRETSYKRKDMSNFFKGAANRDK
jgi:pilus assembly protein Flp/PilA